VCSAKVCRLDRHWCDECAPPRSIRDYWCVAVVSDACTLWLRLLLLSLRTPLLDDRPSSVTAQFVCGHAVPYVSATAPLADYFMCLCVCLFLCLFLCTCLFSSVRLYRDGSLARRTASHRRTRRHIVLPLFYGNDPDLISNALQLNERKEATSESADGDKCMLHVDCTLYCMLTMVNMQYNVDIVFCCLNGLRVHSGNSWVNFIFLFIDAAKSAGKSKGKREQVTLFLPFIDHYAATFGC